MRTWRYYTGVGSRNTPEEMLQVIREIAHELRVAGFILRSGGAEGADTAFANGAGPEADIYLPWRGFNNVNQRIALSAPQPQAFAMAKTVHPSWSRLSAGARALHARNCHQVLGLDLASPSEFLICWTPDGCTSEKARTRESGGTATAIVLADRHGVPVFNLANAADLARLRETRLIPNNDLF